jgi:hypothetical protein
MDIKDELQVSYTISLTPTRWLAVPTNRRHIVDTHPPHQQTKIAQAWNTQSKYIPVSRGTAERNRT